MSLTLRNLLTLSIATLLVSMVFIIFPQLDISISALFVGADGTFSLASAPIPVFLRTAYMVLTVGFLLVILTLFLMSLRLGARRIIPLRIWIYPLMVFLVGPLLLVNGVFKEYWGRARPRDIFEFGGDLQFSPAYVISDQCATNCSFTSGEGAAIGTLAILAGVLVWAGLQMRGKIVLVLGLTVFTAIGAGLRVVTGGHFFSDSALSILFCALIAVAFYRLFSMGRVSQLLTYENLRHDLGVSFTKTNP